MGPHAGRACGGQPRASAQVIRGAGCLREVCVALGDLAFAAAVGGTAAYRIEGSRCDRAGVGCRSGGEVAEEDRVGGGCGGGLLTSMGLVGQALLLRLADAVLDRQSSEGGFEGVHVGLRVWDRVGQIR